MKPDQNPDFHPTNGRESETATLLSRYLLNCSLRVGCFAVSPCVISSACGSLKFMKAIRWVRGVVNALRRGVFPHEMSFFLDLPWRNLMLSPQELVARLALTTTNRVLEVGAGSGFYSVEVARKVSEGHLELLDLQPEMLEKAQQKLEAKGLQNVGYTLADAGKLPLDADSFDVIFIVAVLGEIADKKAFLSEAHRVLKPGGILSISEHLPDPDFLPLEKVKTLVGERGFAFFARHGRKWSYTANFSKLEDPAVGAEAAAQ